MTYREWEADSNFAFNSVLDSNSDSDSDFASASTSLSFLFWIYIPLNKPADIFFFLIPITESIDMQAIKV